MNKPVPAIDVHHHYLPPFYAQYARSWYADAGDAVLKWSPEAALQAMNDGGIETAILSISSPAFMFELSGLDAPALARQCNEYAARLARDHGKRFRVFTALPLPDIDASLREIERGYSDFGAVGVGLMSNYEGHYLGEPHFIPVMEELNRRRAIVHVHPTDAPCCRGLVEDIPTPTLEFLFDTGRTITSLLWSGTFSRFPDIRFIFSHGGGVVASLYSRIISVGRYVPRLIDRIPEGPEAILSRLYADTASLTTRPAFTGAQSWLRPEHILYGTDYPWGHPEAALTAFNRLSLHAQLDLQIKRSNSLALFGPF